MEAQKYLNQIKAIREVKIIIEQTEMLRWKYVYP